jgi:K+-transporting ATPase KdpF subunit
MPAPATASEEPLTMNIDYLLGGALAFALTAYLVFALLHPERF